MNESSREVSSDLKSGFRGRTSPVNNGSLFEINLCFLYTVNRLIESRQVGVRILTFFLIIEPKFRVK